MGKGCRVPADSRHSNPGEAGVGRGQQQCPCRQGGQGGLQGLHRQVHSPCTLVCLFPVATPEKEEDPFNYGEHRHV